MSGSTLFKTLLHICGLIAEGYVRSTASTQNQAMLVHCKNNKICQTSIDSHDVKFQCLHKICKTHIFGYFFFPSFLKHIVIHKCADQTHQCLFDICVFAKVGFEPTIFDF